MPPVSRHNGWDGMDAPGLRRQSEIGRCHAPDQRTPGHCHLPDASMPLHKARTPPRKYEKERRASQGSKPEK